MSITKVKGKKLTFHVDDDQPRRTTVQPKVPLVERKSGSNGLTLHVNAPAPKAMTEKRERGIAGGASAAKSAAELLARRIDERTNTMTPQEKADMKVAGAVKALKKIEQKTFENLEPSEQQNVEFNRRTEHKYDVDYWKRRGDEEKAKLAQQLIKGGYNTADPIADELAIKYHPTAYSATRGFANGATFGLTDYALTHRTGEGADLEAYYQAHKNQTAETLGDLGGSLVAFGVTSAPLTNGVGALVEKSGGNIVKFLSGNPLIRKAAQAELKLAAKRGLVELGTGGTEVLVKQFAENRAKRLLTALGEDVVINLTTGALSDVVRASTNYEPFSNEWWDELKKSAEYNAILGTITSFAPALRTRKGIPIVNRFTKSGGLRDESIEAINRVMRPLDGLVDNATRNADNIAPQPLSELVNIRQQVTPDDLAQRAMRNMDDAAEGVNIRDMARPQTLDEAIERKAVQAVEGAGEGVRPQNVDEAMRPQNLDEAVEEAATKPAPPKKNAKTTPPEVEAPRAETPNTRRTESLEAEAKRLRAEYDASKDEATLRKLVKNNNLLDREYRETAFIDTDEYKAFTKMETKYRNALKKLDPNAAELDEGRLKGMSLFERERLDQETERKAKAFRQALGDEKGAPKVNTEGAEKSAGDMDFAGVSDQEAREAGFAKGGDEIVEAKKNIETEVNKQTLKGSEFDRERGQAYREAGVDLHPEDVEHASVEDVNKARGAEMRDYKTHTEKGFATISTGLGDKAYQGKALEAIQKGELNIEVRHNAENYAKAAKKINEHVAKNGNTDAIAEKFEKYVAGDLKLNKDEQRDLIYDVFAAVDFANANVHTEGAREEMERLYIAACKAGSEQVSIGGLAGNQWRKIAMSSPEFRSKAVYNAVLDMFNRSKGIRQLAGKTKKGDLMTEADLRKLFAENPQLKKAMEALEKVETAASVEEVEKLADRALLEARKIIPMTAFDQLTQWRYVAMLSSPKTHIRNVTANIYSATLGQLRDHIGYQIEDNVFKGKGKAGRKLEAQIKAGNVKADDLMYSTSKMNLNANLDSRKGTAKLFTLNKLQSKLEKARYALETADANVDPKKLEAMKNTVTDLEGRVAKAQTSLDDAVAKIERPTARRAQESWVREGMPNLVQNVEKFEKRNLNGKISKGILKVNDKLSQFIGGALETSDALSLERIYRERFDKILMSNDWERLAKLADEGDVVAKARMKKIEEYAVQEASYIAALDTYRNYTALSSAMSKYVADTLFNYDAPLMKKIGGLVVHATMPFTKVPVNLVKRGIDYSPIGLINAKRHLMDAIESGDTTMINRACERMAEGRIGTGIAALGAGIGFLDPDGTLITGRLKKNDYIDKKKRDAGYQNYAINVGNLSFTLDWATPTSATMFTGIEFGRMLRNLCDDIAGRNNAQFSAADAIDVPITLVSTLFEPTLQLGVFQGIHQTLESVVESDNYSTTNVAPEVRLVEEIFKNYAGSVMTPAIFGALSRAFSPYEYMTYAGGSDIENWANSTKAKYGLGGVNGLLPALGAKTNVWGEIKNEKKTAGDYVKSAMAELLSPATIKRITWDETDEWAADFYRKTGWEGAFPKNFYKREVQIGRTGDNAVKLNARDVADFNVARGRSGSDAMRDALDTVIFNRYEKDEEGHLTKALAGNMSEAEKQRLIKQFEGKSIREVLEYVRNTDAFKNATPAEQKQVLRQIYGDDSGGTNEAVGARRYAERDLAIKRGMTADQYDYLNEVTLDAQETLTPAIDSGLITYAQALDFARNAGKTTYRTDEDGEKGGTVSTYFSKTSMLDYLDGTNLTEAQKAALYNAFTSGKDYGYANTHRKGSGGGGRYYRRGGGKRSAKAKVPTPKKMGTLKSGQALVAKKSSSSSKVTSPTLKRVEIKTDLPKVRR